MQIDDCFERLEGVRWEITKGQITYFGGDWYVYDLHCNDNFIGIYICRNSSNCTAQIYLAYWISIIPE